jgi:flagellar M-ring protein FliF
MEERQAQVEERLRTEIEQLVEPVVGAGKVHAQVAVMLDRDQTREEAEVYDPDKQVIQHQVSVDSKDQNSQNKASADGASVSTQLPDGNGVNGAGRDNQQSAKADTSEDTTFQNSRTHTVSVRSPGKITRLTVAVMVDSAPKGLSPAENQRLTRLIENAVGFDAERGDSVVVDSMAFAPTADEIAAKGGLPFGITTDQVIGLVKILLLAGGALIALRMMMPRLRPAADSTASPNELIPIGGRAEDGDGLPQIENGGVDENGVPLLDQEIALAQVDGRIRLSALKRIGDAITASPAEAASVIRQWMNA